MPPAGRSVGKPRHPVEVWWQEWWGGEAGDGAEELLAQAVDGGHRLRGGRAGGPGAIAGCIGDLHRPPRGGGARAGRLPARRGRPAAASVRSLSAVSEGRKAAPLSRRPLA